MSLSLKWDSKLPQLLAFGGGLASIIREVLNETGHLADFYAVVLENIAIFRNSSNFNVSHELFMPTAELNGKSQRFNACSAQDYVRSKTTALPRLERTVWAVDRLRLRTLFFTEKTKSKVLLYVSLALVVLVTVAVTICVLANVHYKQVVRNKKKTAILKTHRQRKR